MRKEEEEVVVVKFFRNLKRMGGGRQGGKGGREGEEVIRLPPNGWQLLGNGVALDAEEKSLHRLGANRFP